MTRTAISTWRSFYSQFEYSFLHAIPARKRTQHKQPRSCNKAIITLDTETSKKSERDREENHVVIWTITVRYNKRNVCTLYGRRPSDCMKCISMLIDNMAGDEIIVFVHNLAYDWVFLRKFFFVKFGIPKKQLNTKPHYPISIEFENGLILRDSLILAQRSLEKWAKDLGCTAKAVGTWDYTKRRNQDTKLSPAEINYACQDTETQAECIEITMLNLNKWVATLPLTATGISREACRKEARKCSGHEAFKRKAMTFEQYNRAVKAFHGGYTHGNRFAVDVTINRRLVKCYDFCSSYPYVMLSEKYPMEKFAELGNRPLSYIEHNSEHYAFLFNFIAKKIELKDYADPMPSLQLSKCEKSINAVYDNGRILQADLVSIWITEQDYLLIKEQYNYEQAVAVDVMGAAKDYLPRWFTDYIYACFVDKTKLKGGDPVQYQIAKGKANANYGMCVQKVLKDDINEDYDTGEFTTAPKTTEEEYNKLIKSYNMVLPYQWGVWVTCYAMANLFKLSKMCGTWLYSDTDSAYGFDWDEAAVQAYNEQAIAKLQARGYDGVEHNGQMYYLGIAELDGEYTEFKFMGAKRYCGRRKADGKLKLTVAGVPKNGVELLENDIENFRQGFVFDGKKTGKLLHTYCFIDDIYIDENGNETGDSIDLSPDDYTLSAIEVMDWKLFEQEDILNDYQLD